ncbi:hypothetical protein G7074_18960 [Pedobacter sp. HDW13]|uniref:hypothetical protein n=1 Tax=Pedobacter sp. HDW13 TaxID=2714940 RepID=UPI00140C57D6|nr:hypothetical protein [Pedobacter sp. HDW13]QIL41164.1 hypothetical protein G7074_18960 [Pedobacter sp. HDW13]
MNRILKLCLIVVGSGAIFFIGYLIWGYLTFFSMFDRTYSKKDLIENYKIKSKEIYEAQGYAKSIIPTGKKVTIEFENDQSLFIFHLSDKNSDSRNWSLSTNDKKTDSLLNVLGWTKQTLTTLKEKLDLANCISIETGEPFTIGYQRSGMGMYFYNLFDKPLTDSLKKVYNDGCAYILYNNKVALEFGGGAVGQQCFEKP